ncbi:hypothetical protein SAMN05443377_12045 [Propionibacterium cyclohexanicum]|uniref:Uncharacterized protein n=1 Tax=Propionibacterium cyclohexanicum TaxID=64702 RepID=A0A1H9TBI2_9ACTN|nr:hypothetical protein [Propionibacterium cyclohexanicum]SER94304.1 hypothetical protein SAMN05443377_12045 [Propionibacterium cyclohexanicum]
MAPRSSNDPLGWLATLVPTVAFGVLWLPSRALAPMLHTEADNLLHAQLASGALLEGSGVTGRAPLAYWLLAGPMADRSDALTMLRWVSLIAGIIVVFAAARTAAVCWGAASALVCGGLLVVQPLLVPLATTAGPPIPALAAFALASLLTATRLRDYEELGSGTAILHALLLVLAVGLDVSLAPAVIAQIAFAAAKRPSARGWAQLAAGWLLAAAAAAWLWSGGGPRTGPQTMAAVWRELGQALAGPSSLFWLVPAAALLVILVSALDSGGAALRDPGLALAAGLVVLTPLAVVLGGGRWPGAMGAETMTSVVLGVALLAGCAAAQWSGRTRHRIVVVALVVALALVGWRGHALVAPSWHNADGNPPLSRDLAMRAQPGQVVVVDDLAVTGLGAAVAAQLGDARLWQQSRADLPAQHRTIFSVVSSSPWATRPAGLEGVHGRLVWITAEDSPRSAPPACTPTRTDHYGAMEMTEFACP